MYVITENSPQGLYLGFSAIGHVELTQVIRMLVDLTSYVGSIFHSVKQKNYSGKYCATMFLSS